MPRYKVTSFDKKTAKVKASKSFESKGQAEMFIMKSDPKAKKTGEAMTSDRKAVFFESSNTEHFLEKNRK